METTIDDLIGAPDTLETPQVPDEVNTVTGQTGLEEPKEECESK